MQNYSKFSQIFVKYFYALGQFRTIMVNIAKTHILLVKKEISDVVSSNIVWHDWKMIFVFKLKRKTYCSVK